MDSTASTPVTGDLPLRAESVALALMCWTPSSRESRYGQPSVRFRLPIPPPQNACGTGPSMEASVAGHTHNPSLARFQLVSSRPFVFVGVFRGASIVSGWSSRRSGRCRQGLDHGKAPQRPQQSSGSGHQVRMHVFAVEQWRHAANGWPESPRVLGESLRRELLAGRQAGSAEPETRCGQQAGALRRIPPKRAASMAASGGGTAMAASLADAARLAATWACAASMVCAYSARLSS